MCWSWRQKQTSRERGTQSYGSHEIAELPTRPACAVCGRKS